MSPREVDDCTLWQFSCAVEGFRQANTPDKDQAPPMSDDQLAELGIEGF